MRLLVAALLAVATLVQAPQGPPPRFRSGVDVVLLDVTVLDRNRRPVLGLKPEDFTVLEDGDAQRIVSFDEMSAPEPDGSLVPWMREVAPEIRTNSDDHRRLVLIVLHDAAIQMQYRRDVQEIGQKVLDHLGPNDHAAIVFTGDNARSQDFTSDRGALRRTIERYVDTSAGALGPIYGIRTVRRAVESLVQIPHRRKALIYVGGSLTAATPPPTVMGQFEGFDTSSQVSFETREAIKHAQRANVTVYTVNPMRLQAPGPGATLAGLSLGALNNEVNETGGFAIANTNSFDEQIRQIFRETGSYYLIGFQSPHADGRFRKLQVKVNRPDVTVRTRNGYLARRPERERRAERPTDTPLPLARALASLLPVPDVPMRVQVGAFAAPGKDAATAAIVLGLVHPAPSAAGVVETVDVMTQAYDALGKPRGWFRQVAQLKLRPSESREAKYEVLSRLDLRPGRYQLRFGVHSTSLGRSGSVYQDIEVPNFKKDSLALSGLVIGVKNGLPAAPRGFLDGLLPVQPTTQRSFAPSDLVRGFLRLHQSGKKIAPAAVSIAVIDQTDRIVHEAKEVRETALFTAGSVDQHFEIPLSSLAPGPYLLRVTVRAGTHQGTREVRFFVRER